MSTLQEDMDKVMAKDLALMRRKAATLDELAKSFNEEPWPKFHVRMIRVLGQYGKWGKLPTLMSDVTEPDEHPRRTR